MERRTSLATDNSWLVTRLGNYRETEFYNGEVYDAGIDRKRILWESAGLEKLKINPVLEAQYGSPVRIKETLEPVSGFRAESGNDNL